VTDSSYAATAVACRMFHFYNVHDHSHAMLLLNAFPTSSSKAQGPVDLFLTSPHAVLYTPVHKSSF